jgi:septin family protein
MAHYEEATTNAGPKPFTVFVEGNIGSGKTTFLNHFQKFDGVCLLTEPVEKWRDCAGVNLLVSTVLPDGVIQL